MMADMRELPIVCTLSPGQVRSRKEVLLPGLVALAEEKIEFQARSADEVSEGFRYRFAATTENLSSIARTIDAERQCCRFLRFELVVEEGAGPIWLTVIGPPGSREFLEQLG
jgi:hypothetical protein